MSENTAQDLRAYTWDDYCAMDDDKRLELINGVPLAMSPAPTPRHQQIVGDLFGEMRMHFAGKKCRPYVAPVDVRLSDQDIVQPDVVVVCDPDQIKETYIDGAPSLVVEVLSPSTASRDRGRKVDLYARSGVKEVWLVTPYPHLIEVFLLGDGVYQRIRACTEEDAFASPSFPEITLDLKALFDIPLTPNERITVVKESSALPYARGTE
jgi:Uma2 family endonuclease